MNIVHQVMQNVIKNKTKTVILFVVILFLGVIISSTLAIDLSLNNIGSNIEKNLSPVASIELDQYNKRLVYQKQVLGELTEEDQITLLTREDMEKFGKLPQVKYYDYNQYGFLELPENFKRYQIELEQVENIPEEEKLPVQVQIYGTQMPEVRDIMENRIQLVDGRVFTTEEIMEGKRAGLISAEFAEINGLKIGDNIPFSQVVRDTTNGAVITSEPVGIEVIGIFKMNVENEESSENPELNSDPIFYNRVYVPNGVVTNVNLFFDIHNPPKAAGAVEALPIFTNNGIESAFFMLKSSDKKELTLFSNEVKKAIPKDYKLSTTGHAFQVFAKSLNTMSHYTRTILIGTVFFSVLILLVIFLLFLRRRNEELIAYLKNGRKKGFIFLQIFLETLSIAIFALLFAAVIGNVVATKIAPKVDTAMKQQLQSQILMPEEESALFISGYMQDVETELREEKIQVAFSSQYIILLYTIGIVIIGLASIPSFMYVFRLQWPKKR